MFGVTTPDMIWCSQTTTHYDRHRLGPAGKLARRPVLCVCIVYLTYQPRKVIYTLVYVIPFYLSSKTRPSRTLSRDAPSVIRARITSVSLTCIFCSVCTFLVLTSQGHLTRPDAVHSMGYWPVGLAETAKTLLLTAILFAGPLYETFVVHGAWRDWMSLQPVTELFSEWTTWRNIVAVSRL